MFSFFKKSPNEKANDLEQKGDRLLAKGNFAKAYQCYHQAVELDESRSHLFDKLIQILEDNQDEWDEEHFAHSVHWQMQKQEAEDPTFKRIHARNDPEHQIITSLIKNMLSAKTQKEETEFIEEIAEFQGLATYPLIDFILAFKEISSKPKTSKQNDEEKDS